MLYMLDTNICAYILREKPQVVKEKLKRVSEAGHEVGLSSVVVSELFYGAFRKGSPKLLKVIEEFVEAFRIYAFDLEAAREYGRLRTELERKGELTGPYDLQIAAHVLALGAVLVTNNERKFRRVSRLKVENWAPHG